MRYFVVVLMLLLAGAVSGQTVQRGVVREYNELAAKTPLAGVELTVRSAGSTVSDKDGSFALEFLTAQPGERVNVRRIEKEGYVIFNKEAVEQWNLSPTTPFVLVMCRADRFKRIRDTYYRNSESRYAAQYKKERDELARLQKEGRLKDEEYRRRLAEVSAEYERQLDNLDAYVDRFARIDLSEISAVEQEIIGLVEAGRFEDAIKKYEDLRIKEQLVEALGQRRKIDAAISRLSDARGGLALSIDSLYGAAERQIETLRLAGGVENNRKILDIYREIAQADTANVEWLLRAGEFAKDYLSDYQQASGFFNTALASARQERGEGSLGEAAAYGYLGDLLHLRGQYAAAGEMHRRALAIREKLLGGEAPILAETYNRLGNAAYRLGDYAQAMDCYGKAVEIWDANASVDSPEKATTYNDMGNALADMGNLAAALDNYRRALAIREALLPGAHPDLAVSYVNIGNILADLGNVSEALESYRRALDIQERVFGPEHPDVAATCKNIGSVYSDAGEDAEALGYFRRALAIEEKLLGPEHPRVASTYSNIGLTYFYQGDYPEALAHFHRALDIRERALPPGHSDLGKVCVHIGNVYYNQDNPAQALAWYRRGLDILLPALGKDNRLVSGVMAVIAEIEAGD